jgi:hypothetical protein
MKGKNYAYRTGLEREEAGSKETVIDNQLVTTASNLKTESTKLGLSVSINSPGMERYRDNFKGEHHGFII